MKLNSINKHTESSKKWLKRQLNDPFIKKAKIEGYRSRAAYKLIEIDKKYRIFKKNSVIIDVGSSPGSWSEASSQICRERKLSTRIIAIDLIKMQPIDGVEFILGSFKDIEVKDQILKLLGESKVNIILNDMAPNSTGQKAVDHLKIMNLCEEVLGFSKSVLAKGGILVNKIFKGSQEQEFVKTLRKNFESINYFKPESSRKESNEIYIVAMGFVSAK
jgi:23S rRNA (uridine2552-2'-O)-methyltransferase